MMGATHRLHQGLSRPDENTLCPRIVVTPELLRRVGLGRMCVTLVHETGFNLNCVYLLL